MGEESLALFFSLKTATICLHIKITFQLRALLEDVSFYVFIIGCYKFEEDMMEEIILVVKFQSLL